MRSCTLGRAPWPVLDRGVAPQVPSIGVHSHFTRYRQLSRWLAALVLVTGWVVPLAVPHYADDDPICFAPLSAGDTGSGRIDKPGAASQPGHCLVCHTARSFRSVLDSAAHGSVQLAAVGVLVTPAGLPQHTAVFDRGPARAPPSPDIPTLTAV